MKTLNKFLTISAVAFLLMLMAPHKSMAQDYGYVSDQEFYDNLQNYGTWVYDEQYGNVWVPDVDGDFRPYATNGYWVQTDYGTTWVSDYPWGWATFHYGRWRYDDYYGWEWIPGHEWAPAWVSWREGGGYYSWAPMQPGITISISLGGGYYVPDSYWVCAPQAYITSRYINRYYAPPTRVVTIIHNTTYIHNTYVYNNNTYIVGPRPSDIQRVTHRPVTIYKVNSASKPGAAHFGGHSINIYRPAIQKSADAKPVRVVNATAYRQAHPNDGIGVAGITANVHTKAAKLSAVAHSTNPDSRVVRVNPAPVKNQAPAVNNNKANATAAPVHPALSGGHKSIGPVVQNPQSTAPTAKAHNVAPAVMPPADHHNPTVRQPATNPDAAAAQQQQAQARQQAQQAAQQQKMQQQQQQAQAQQQVQQQKMQQVQARQQAQQAVQQQKMQQQAQASQQSQQAAQQQKIQQQQQQAQTRQQAQQQSQQARQQAQAQAHQQAQQQAQQLKMQQQQQQAQARQQAQQAAQQARQQQQQQQAQARQQAQQQQKMQQQQQQAAQRAAREAAQKQQQEEQKKQQTPPGN